MNLKEKFQEETKKVVKEFSSQKMVEKVIEQITNETLKIIKLTGQNNAKINIDTLYMFVGLTGNEFNSKIKEEISKEVVKFLKSEGLKCNLIKEDSWNYLLLSWN